MQKIDFCTICGSSNLKPFISCVDYTVSKEIFQIIGCEECSFKFTNPRPDQKEIGKYYHSEDYISHSNSKKGILNRIYQYVRNFTISQKLALVGNHVSRGTILDIGCGTGEFLNFAKQKGWETKGIEPGNEARKYAKEIYNLDVQEENYLNSIGDNSYDAITMWHVLEHVHELNSRIEELKRIVKPNGVVIIAVPNHTCYDARLYKEFWAAYDLPRHLYHFTPKNLEFLFAKHGLKRIETLPMRFDSFYVSILSEKYKYGKINYFKAFKNGLLSNLKAASQNNNSYSSQTYIFRK